MIPQKFDLPACKTGTTFKGFYFDLPAEDIYNLAYAAVIMQVRKGPGEPLVHEFKPGNGTLVIEQPYRIVIPSQLISIKPGTYHYDMRIRFADQRNNIYVEGIWPILSVISTNF